MLGNSTDYNNLLIGYHDLLVIYELFIWPCPFCRYPADEVGPQQAGGFSGRAKTQDIHHKGIVMNIVIGNKGGIISALQKKVVVNTCR